MTANGDSLEFLDGRRRPAGDTAYYSALPQYHWYGPSSFPPPNPDGSSGIYRWEPVAIDIPAGTFRGYELSEAELGGRFFSFIPGVGWAKASSFSCLGEVDYLQLEYARIDGREYGISSAVRAEPHPAQLRLLPPSPNPFNPSTAIRFELDAREWVRLTVYTATGQKVTDLCDAVLSPGAHTFTWRPERCAAGLYLYLVRAGNETRAGKMMLVK
jgi:hypothetical protein